MLETLATIVTLAKLGEAHGDLLRANMRLLDMGGDFWPEIASIRRGLLARIRGSLAVVGINPESWPMVAIQGEQNITWA